MDHGKAIVARMLFFALLTPCIYAQGHRGGASPQQTTQQNMFQNQNNNQNTLQNMNLHR